MHGAMRRRAAADENHALESSSGTGGVAEQGMFNFSTSRASRVQARGAKTLLGTLPPELEAQPLIHRKPRKRGALLSPVVLWPY